MNIIEGDLLENVKEGLILQQVNAQGVMGSGFAKAVYERWPIVKQLYSTRFSQRSQNCGADYLGMVQTIEVQPNLYVLNLVAQQYYGRDGKRYTSYDALDTCLETVANLNKSQNLPVHHPLLGSGLGGGYWPIVECIIEAHLGSNTTLWLV